MILKVSLAYAIIILKYVLEENNLKKLLSELSVERINDNVISLTLFGSYREECFRDGHSDIDILVLMKYTDFDIECEIENYYYPLLKEYFNYDNIHFTFIGLNAFDSVFAEIYIDYEDKIIFDIENHYDFLMYINKFNRVNENLINLIKKDWESKYGVL